MSRVTSKRQVTIPLSIAREYGIDPGSQIVFEPAGDTIRVRVASQGPEDSEQDRDWKLQSFDEATARQLVRNRRFKTSRVHASGRRGWTRDDLYPRAIPR